MLQKPATKKTDNHESFMSPSILLHLSIERFSEYHKAEKEPSMKVKSTIHVRHSQEECKKAVIFESRVSLHFYF